EPARQPGCVRSVRVDYRGPRRAPAHPRVGTAGQRPAEPAGHDQLGDDHRELTGCTSTVATGRLNENAAPPPVASSTHAVPCIASTDRRTMYRPRPTPCCGRVR